MKISKTALAALAIVLSSQSFATNEIQHDANQKRLESVVSVLDEGIYTGAVKCKAEPLTCEGNTTIGQQTLAQVEGIKNMILAEMNRSTFQSEDLVIDDAMRAKAKASVKPNIENNLKLDELGLNIQRAATL